MKAISIKWNKNSVFYMQEIKKCLKMNYFLNAEYIFKKIFFFKFYCKYSKHTNK